MVMKIYISLGHNNTNNQSVCTNICILLHLQKPQPYFFVGIINPTVDARTRSLSSHGSTGEAQHQLLLLLA